MTSSMWQSFVKAVAPGCDQLVWGQASSHNHMVGGCPLSCESKSGQAQEPVSKASLEHRGVIADSDVTQHGISHNIRVGESDTDSEVEFHDSRQDLPSEGLEGPSVIPTSAPNPILNTSIVNTRHFFGSDAFHHFTKVECGRYRFWCYG